MASSSLFARDSRETFQRYQENQENSKRRSTYNPRGDDFCRGCGSNKHVRGNKSCENSSLYTFHLRDTRDKEDRRDQKKEPRKSGEGSKSPQENFLTTAADTKEFTAGPGPDRA